MHTVTLYADTLSYKTSELRKIARWLFSRNAIPVRYIAADISGLKILSDVIEAGIVEPFIIPKNVSPFSIMNALSRGCWTPWLPQAPSPQSGGKPSVRLMGPNEDFQWQGKRYLNYIGPGVSYMIEGYSTIAQHMLIYLVQNQKSKALTNAFTITEESYDPSTPAGELIASAAMPHYGAVQNRMLELTTSFAQIPGDFAFWTSHEAKGKDEFSGGLQLGPRLVGKAGTPAVLPLLHDYFHIDIVPVMYQGPPLVSGGPPQLVEVQERHAYYERHACREIPGAYWPATIRMAFDALHGVGMGAGPYQKIKARWPQGFLNLSRGESILDYLLLREEVLSVATTELTAWADGIRAQFNGSGPKVVEIPAGASAAVPVPQLALPGIPNAKI